MPSSTVENYLKQIFLLSHESGEDSVPMGRIASALNLSPGTITTMIKSLAEADLVAYEPRVGVSLTSSGRKLALRVLRRHRLIELFLVEILGMDWSQVHPEAEALEHAVSDEVVLRMEELLKFPQFDPHGDPIPSAQGELKTRRLISLLQSEPGQTVKVARILDQASDFLHFVNASSLSPGRTVKVEDISPAGQTLSVRSRNQVFVLSFAAAEKIQVEPR